MKKKIFCAIALLAILAVSVFNVSLGSTKGSLLDISLNSTEALSQSEYPNYYSGEGGCATLIEIYFNFAGYDFIHYSYCMDGNSDYCQYGYEVYDSYENFLLKDLIGTFCS